MEPPHRTDQVDPRSILVVLPTWVGDFVMATPALRAVRSRFSQARIVFLMEPNLAELIRGGDWMDECLAWPEKNCRTPFHREYRNLIRDLRGRKLDLALLLPNSFHSAALARLAGAKRRVGYDRDARGWLLTDRVPVKNRTGRPSWADEVPCTQADKDPARNGAAFPEKSLLMELGGPRIWPGPNVAVRMGKHLPASLGPYWPIPMAEYYADLVESIGCLRPDDRLELFVTPDNEASVEQRLAEDVPPPGFSDGVDSGPLVIISPGAKFGASKCWLPPRYAEVADRLIQLTSASVLITCGPGEEPMAREIAAGMKHRAVVLERPLLTLGELKSVIRRAHLLICTDSGPRHIAKAFGIPVVTLFGSTHPDWTATSYEDERIVRVDIDCGPCQQKACPLGHHLCMTGITSDIVLAAAMDLLALPRSAKAIGQLYG